MSNFGRLRSYDRFFIRVHALVWTASIIWRVAIFSQLQTERSRYLDTWEVAKACGERRGGLICPATASVPATGVQNSSHLGASVTFTMPFTFLFEEYADMIYVCMFCDGNSVLAVAEYQQRFPNCRIPNRRVFTGVYQALRDTGRPVLQPSVVLMKASMKKALFVWYTAVHVRVREDFQDVFVFLTRECGKHCTQRACIHTTCSECNISDRAILLRGWNFASGSMAVASCIVFVFVFAFHESTITIKRDIEHIKSNTSNSVINVRNHTRWFRVKYMMMFNTSRIKPIVLTTNTKIRL